MCVWPTLQWVTPVTFAHWGGGGHISDTIRYRSGSHFRLLLTCNPDQKTETLALQEISNQDETEFYSQTYNSRK